MNNTVTHPPLHAAHSQSKVTPPAPSRNPYAGSGRRNFRAKACSLKCGRHVRCESLLEWKATRLFELVAAVTSYSEQPPPLRLKIGSSRSRYTPDFRVDWSGGKPWLVEVKPREFADSDWWRQKFDAAAIASVASGFQFVVLTEEHIAAAGLEDVLRVLDSRHRRYVQALGEPRAPANDDVSACDVECRVLRVLAQALEGSRSISICRDLGCLSRPAWTLIGLSASSMEGEKGCTPRRVQPPEVVRGGDGS